VFELSRRDGLRYSEIAVVLGISVKTVEAQMGKALRVLRTELAAWLPAGRDLA
jgi:RNA polymerase sigma-70 factor (ECF subfamily)